MICLMPFLTPTMKMGRRPPCQMMNSLVQNHMSFHLTFTDVSTGNIFIFFVAGHEVCLFSLGWTRVYVWLHGANRRQPIHCASYSAFWQSSRRNRRRYIKRPHHYSPRTKLPYKILFLLFPYIILTFTC